MRGTRPVSFSHWERNAGNQGDKWVLSRVANCQARNVYLLSFLPSSVPTPAPPRAPGPLPCLEAFSGSDVSHLPLSGSLSKQFPLPGPLEPSLVLPVKAAGVPGSGGCGGEGQVRRRSQQARWVQLGVRQRQELSRPGSELTCGWECILTSISGHVGNVLQSTRALGLGFFLVSSCL